MSIPNFISLARLLSVPLAVWLIVSGQHAWAFWLFIAAGISDAVDGYIAKRFDAQTTLGRYLDPLADKVLLVSLYIVLGVRGYLPAWLVTLVVTRDFLIIGGLVLANLLGRSLRVQPLLISKANTVTQILLIGWALCVLGLEISDRGVSQVLIYIVAATTVLSGASYLVRWNRLAASLEGDR